MFKILFLAANPQDPALNRVHLEREIREIQQKLRATPHRDTVKLELALAVRPSDWLTELNEHRPHIVHFSGHGYQSGEILCERPDGLPQEVTPQALASVFRSCKDNIRLVILNACYSKVQAEAIRQEIDCVIGMNAAITNRAATIFTSAFYTALGYGRSVQEAFNQGLAALEMEGLASTHIPELLARLSIDPTKVQPLPLASQQSTSSPNPPPPEDRGAISIFYCYAPEDREFCTELEKHLAIMRRTKLIRSWYGQDVRGGDKEEAKAWQELNAAQIILLLVSPALLSSDDTLYSQIEHALVRREQDHARVIPIIVRPTNGWKDTEFGNVVSLPRDRPPISQWSNRDAAFANIAHEIQMVVNEERKKLMG